jgi:hypothetical protein
MQVPGVQILHGSLVKKSKKFPGKMVSTWKSTLGEKGDDDVTGESFDDDSIENPDHFCFIQKL